MISLMLALWMLHGAPPPAMHVPRHEVCPGATHFYEWHHPKPYWAKNMVVVCTIGNHVFLRERTTKERHEH